MVYFRKKDLWKKQFFAVQKHVLRKYLEYVSKNNNLKGETSENHKMGKTFYQCLIFLPKAWFCSAAVKMSMYESCFWNINIHTDNILSTCKINLCSPDFMIVHMMYLQLLGKNQNKLWKLSENVDIERLHQYFINYCF